MKFRLGVMLGFAIGYYLGAMAGHQRYDQINKMLKKLRQSDAFETVTGKAKAVVDLSVERAKDVVSSDTGNGASTIPQH
jgi:hypothetical protein